MTEPTYTLARRWRSEAVSHDVSLTMTVSQAREIVAELTAFIEQATAPPTPPKVAGPGSAR